MWIFRYSLLEKSDGLGEARLVHMSGQSVSAKIKIVRAQISRRRRLQPPRLSWREFYPQGISDLLCQLAFQIQNISQIALVALRPEMRVTLRINQLHVDQHLLTSFLHTAFEDGGNVQYPPHFA